MEQNTREKEAIEQQMDCFVDAFRKKDVHAMMSLFFDDMVSFDIIPPLQYAGSEVYRKVWQETFALFRDPMDVQIRDLKVFADNTLAFSHCFLQLTATMVDGHKVNYWERLTCCFRKVNGKWLIVHEHVSLPADLKNGKAVMTLEP